MKTGRPKRGEQRERLKMITFRVDAETDQALEELVRREGGALRARSMVLRRLILAEARKQ